MPGGFLSALQRLAVDLLHTPLPTSYNAVKYHFSLCAQRLEPLQGRVPGPRVGRWRSSLLPLYRF